MSRMTELGWCGDVEMVPLEVERDVVVCRPQDGPPVYADCSIRWSMGSEEFTLHYDVHPSLRWMIDEVEKAVATRVSQRGLEGSG